LTIFQLNVNTLCAIRWAVAVTKAAQVEPRSGRVEGITLVHFQLNVSTLCGIHWVVSVVRRRRKQHRLSWKVDEWKLQLSPRWEPTLVYFSAQRKQTLWETSGVMKKNTQVELESGKVETPASRASSRPPHSMAWRMIFRHVIYGTLNPRLFC